ncbi:MAG: T9SS type A sorting domain-containing protein [Flavobacteriales bacterium]|nr:T9SS type A sorting domain-containing protein [Flavobacteriales bacterium]
MDFKFICTIALFFSVLAGKTQDFNGYALYNSQNSSTTYLIDKNGDIAHSWSCNVNGNYAVLLKENGNIVRGGVYNNNQLNGAAIGGMIQEYDPSGTVVWEFVYSTSDYCQHHDIEIMPNGNVLFLAWEVKSTAELTAAGYDGANSSKWPTRIVEIQPDGNGSASVIWEWHIWDHLIQDFDSSKDNYGVVADHPELMDINAVATQGGGGPGGNSGDWFHANGINYNESLDQIVFTARHASEFFIIDHSTTTAEAATHSGGNSSQGGDLLYRWGNPSNYGASGAQIVPAAVHDPRWIKDDGRENGGFIQIFNNEGDNGNSSVDAIDTPQNGYNYTITPGSAFGPSSYTWRHSCLDNAYGQSAHDKLSNGNTFVNLSNEYMYEVDANDNIVWQYNASPAKAFRYECTHPGVQLLMGVDCNCDAGGSAYMDNCGICVGGNTGLTECSGVGIEAISSSPVALFPNPSTGVFELRGLGTINDYSIEVTDVCGKIIRRISSVSSIDLSNESRGIYFVAIYIADANPIVKKVSVIK